MNRIVAAVALSLFALAAQAQEGPTPEQLRMSDCNAQANKQKVMRFGERKAYVDACMRGETPKIKSAAATPAKKTAAKTAAKQDKTQVCSKQASDRRLKGEDRKKYMTQCTKA